MERLIDARGLRLGSARPRRRMRPLRTILAPLLRRRALRRRVLATIAVLALLALGWIGLRRSPLVSVTHVRVSGVHGLYSGEIERALTRAARHQTTLALDARALRAAVAPFGVVHDLRLSVSFPHTLRIGVSEQLPVATLVAPGARAAVAGDGVVLSPTVAIGGTPQIPVPALPTRHVSDPVLLSELEALAPAPAPLLRRVTRIFFGPQGLTLVMRTGLQIYFGDSALAHAKWIAAALVIGDPASAGASYVDVRLPDRPAAGGLSPSASTPPGTAVGSATAGASTPAGLAAALAAALAGSSTPTTGAAGAGTTAPTTGTGPTAANATGSAGTLGSPASVAPGGTSGSTGG